VGVTVFFVRIEVRGLEGCQMPKDVKSAFVNCVVPAADRDEAMKKLETTLNEDKYELVNVAKIELFYELVFDEEHKHYLKMAEDAEKTGDVHYGEFNVWS